jgi:hypothetical protein
MCFDPIALHGDEFSVLLSFLFDKVRVDQSLVFLTVVCLFIFFFWPLCCLSFFDLRLLISFLISSNLSWNISESLVFCVLFYRSLFVLLSFFLLAIVLSVLRFTGFGIFKLFLKYFRISSFLRNVLEIAIKSVWTINM